MKNTLFIFVALFLAWALTRFGPTADPSFACARDQFRNERLLQDIVYAKRFLDQQTAHQRDRPRTNLKTQSTEYVIPVVFHIIHNNGPENLTDAAIQLELEHLNQAFANTGPYDPTTGVDTRIRFCLARRTPDDQQFNGITRTVSALTESAPDVDMVDSIPRIVSFDSRRYVNIWIVKELCLDTSYCAPNGIGLGPINHGSIHDGIFIESRYAGKNSVNSVLLVHEMGHYLASLEHTDPEYCTSSYCSSLQDSVCNNYMLPGIPECRNAFTVSQRNRMLGILQGVRKSLTTSLSCLPPCPDPAVFAEFMGGADTVALGATLTFENRSSETGLYQWLVNDTLRSTSRDFSYQFLQERDYTVELRVIPPDSTCYPAVQRQRIAVRCLLGNGFDLPPDADKLGQQLHLAAKDSNATYRWTLNSSVISTNDSSRVVLDKPGVYRICLDTETPYCAAEYCRRLLVDNTEDSCPIESETACLDPFLYRYFGSAPTRLEDFVIAPTAWYLGGEQDRQPLIMATDSAGRFDWAIRLPIHNGGVVSHLGIDSEGMLFGVCQGLYSFSDSYVFRFDPFTRTLLWFREFSDGYIFGIEAKNDSTYRIWGLSKRWVQDSHFQINIDRASAELTGSPTTLLFEQSIWFATRDRDAAGHILWTGSQYWGLSRGHRPVVLKTTEDGTVLWQKSYFLDTSVNRISLVARDILPADGSFWLLSGENAHFSDDGRKFYLTHHDAQGEFAFGFTIEAPLPLTPYQLLRQDDQLFILARDTEEGAYLISLTTSGAWLWSKHFPNNRHPFNPYTLFTVYEHSLLLHDSSLYLYGLEGPLRQSNQGHPIDTVSPIQIYRLDKTGNPAGRCPLGYPFTVEISPLPALQSTTTFAARDSADFFWYPNDSDWYSTSFEEERIDCPIACPPELCGDGCDNDHDGLTDCADPDLQSDCCCYVPPPFELGPDRLIPNARGIDLAAPAGFREYRWEDGSSAPTRHIRTAGVYALTAVDSCGTIHGDTIRLDYDAAFFAQRLYLPTAFSPNGDNVNDYWRPYPGPDVARVTLVQIFSRKGDLLYEYRDLDPQDPAAGWDGTADGRPLDTGVYVYQVVIQTHAGERIKRSGTILLHR